MTEPFAGIRERFARAETTGDLSFFEALLADDAVIMPPGQSALEGKAACMEFIRGVIAEVNGEFDREIELTSAEVEVHGDWALDRGTFSQRLVRKEDGSELREAGKYFWLYRRMAGTWKLGRIVGNYDWREEDEEAADADSASPDAEASAPEADDSAPETDAMTTRVEEFRQLYAFNRWATERVLEAAARLPPDQLLRDMGSSFPSIRDTLVHIMSAEWVWLSRWRGSSPAAMPEGWKDLGLTGIADEWTELDRQLRRFVETLDASELDRIVSYRNLSGDAFRTPLSQMLRHVVNHSSYHRGQVATLLRQLGARAPATDLIAFYREEANRS
jgi:uncharacterized damage-inducible protein DinB/ketosteroid isomerase-like protein